MQSSPRKCQRCGDELADGVRFCIACGATNSDDEAGREAIARIDMKLHADQSRQEGLLHWWRRLVFGIRR